MAYLLGNSRWKQSQSISIFFVRKISNEPTNSLQAVANFKIQTSKKGDLSNWKISASSQFEKIQLKFSLCAEVDLHKSRRKNSKMNKFLVVFLLCIASTSGLLLENICSSSSFEYNGIVLVNAFHRIAQNVTFEPLKNVLVPSSITCDPGQFQDKANHLEALRIKNK